MRRIAPGLERGITLVELLFAVAIIAILGTVSLPALGGLMRSEQSRSAHNALVTALNLARSTAAARGSDVAVCPSADGANCDASVWWQHGWIAFVDGNGDGKRAGDETIVQVGPSLAGIAIASSAGRRHVSYRGDGSSPGSNLTFTLCDSRGPSSASTIVVSNSGRIRTGKASAAQAAAACQGVHMP